VTRLSPGIRVAGPLNDFATVKFDIFNIGVDTLLLWSPREGSIFGAAIVMVPVFVVLVAVVEGLIMTESTIVIVEEAGKRLGETLMSE